MATAKTENTNMSEGTVFPSCPVCLQSMIPPIYMCQSGHSVCGPCTGKLTAQQCPVCRQPMTKMRNRSLEELISKAKVPCPHHDNGCSLIQEYSVIRDHSKECVFRDVSCPIAAVPNGCRWTGPYNQFEDHAKERHPRIFKVGCEAKIELQRIAPNNDRRVHILSHQKYIFIVTFKIILAERLVYWTVQLMGPKKLAHKFNYEIHVTSSRDPHKKVIFMERCLSDSVKTDDIFTRCACAVMPLDSLAHFTTDYQVHLVGYKVLYRVVIKNNNSGNSHNCPSSSRGGTRVMHHRTGSSSTSSGNRDQSGQPGSSQMGA